jgi:hypothetical protein
MDIIYPPPTPNSNEVIKIQITWQIQQVEEGMHRTWPTAATYLTLERLSWQFGRELRPVDPRDITLRLLTRRGVIGRGDNWGAGTRVSMSSSKSMLSSPSPRPVSWWGLNSMEYRDVRAPPVPFRFVPYLLTCATWAKKHVHIHNHME